MNSYPIKFSTLFFALVALSSCSSSNSGTPRIDDGNLLPCPASPNCVSSQAIDADQKVEPILFTETKKEKIHTRLIKALSAMDRVEIATNTSDHIHAVFTTKFFRFKDDLDLYIDGENNIVQVRSASRTGYSDFGVNRKRIETLKLLLKKSDT